MTFLDRLRPTSSIRRDREPGEPYCRQFFWRFRLPAPLDCEILGHRPKQIPLNTLRGSYVKCVRCHRRPSRPGVSTFGHKTGRPGLFPFDTLDEYVHYVATEDQVVWSERRAAIGLEVARGYIDCASARFSIGTQYSETPIDASVIIPGVAGLYLSFEGLGTRLAARRGDADQSMVTGIRIAKDAVSWEVWHPKHSWETGTPKWRYNHVTWSSLLFGASRTDGVELDEAEAEVTLPEGSYPVRVTFRRYITKWSRIRPPHTWYRADVSVIDKAGVQDGSRGGISSMAFPLPSLVDRDTWVSTGIARFTAHVMAERAKRTGDVLWTPPADQEARA
jgi:hypothetical protein